MRKSKKFQLWDTYYERQLKVLVLSMEFDFERIARTMNNITGTKFYTAVNCSQKWTEIHKKRKNDQSSTSSMLNGNPNANPSHKTVREMYEELPETRQARNFLHISPEDIKNAESISAITGEKITPTGTHRCLT